MPRKLLATYAQEDQRASELLAGLVHEGPHRIKVADLRRTGALRGFKAIGNGLLRYVGTQETPAQSPSDLFADGSPVQDTEAIEKAKREQAIQHKGTVKQVQDFSQRELFPQGEPPR